MSSDSAGAILHLWVVDNWYHWEVIEYESSVVEEQLFPAPIEKMVLTLELKPVNSAELRCPDPSCSQRLALGQFQGDNLWAVRIFFLIKMSCLLFKNALGHSVLGNFILMMRFMVKAFLCCFGWCARVWVTEINYMDSTRLHDWLPIKKIHGYQQSGVLHLTPVTGRIKHIPAGLHWEEPPGSWHLVSPGLFPFIFANFKTSPFTVIIQKYGVGSCVSSTKSLSLREIWGAPSLPLFAYSFQYFIFMYPFLDSSFELVLTSSWSPH